MSESLHVGVNVSADSLDVCTSSGDVWRLTHDASGIRSLVQRLSVRRIGSIVIAASTGDPANVAAELSAAHLPVTMVTPRLLHEFSRKVSRPRAEDEMDAATLMNIARTIRPPAPDTGFFVRTY